MQKELNDMTSSKFEDIRITGIIKDEISEPRNDDSPRSALYSIPFSLSGTPDTEWSRLFVRIWDNPPSFTTMHRPKIASVYGDKVVLNGTTIEEVERYHKKTLQLVVSVTNQRYRELRVKEEESRVREEAERQEHRRQVEGIVSRIKFD